jgi:hypothetical protein
MVELSIMILIAIVAQMQVEYLNKQSFKLKQRPFRCVKCTAFWYSLIIFSLLGSFELILPSYLIAIFYDNQSG